tara:strand:- start:2291 stop:2764 length:474 start_codon:yes stop_codon:yes gene_type:complete
MNLVKSIVLTPLIVILLTNSCSYQKMNSADQKKFHIKEFEINGGTRESFIIQKKIQRFSNNESSNKIKILINLKKNKTIKEKNIQNKVTKYNLSLSAEVKIIDLNTSNEVKRSFNAIQTYNVDDSYSNTVNNSKDANNLLIDEIVDEILDQLRIYYS